MKAGLRSLIALCGFLTGSRSPRGALVGTKPAWRLNARPSGNSQTGVLFWVLLVAALPLAQPAYADATAETTPAAGGWGETLLEPFAVVTHWVGNLFSHEERFVADEIADFKHKVDSDLSSFDALVRQAGFTIASVSVGASLVPEVSLSLEVQRRLSETEKAALLAKITDPASGIGTVERSVIMTLLNAAESGYAIRGDGFRLSGVDIDLDIIPNVTFIMAPDSH